MTTVTSTNGTVIGTETGTGIVTGIVTETGIGIVTAGIAEAVEARPEAISREER